MKTFLQYIELWLSAFGVAVILAVPAILGARGLPMWRITAQTAIAVGVIHGIIFWSIRARQRRVRRHTLAEAQAMLRDGVHRQVAALLSMDATATDTQRRQLDGVFDSLVLLDHLLASLSDERLREWSQSPEGRREMLQAAERQAGPGRGPDLNVHRGSMN